MTCIHPRFATLKTRKWNKINTKTGTISPKGSYYIDFHATKSKKSERIPVKCGKCIGCRLDHATETAVRCWMETQEHPNGKSMFLTLTYNQKNLPIGPKGHPTLMYSDVQSFLKRLRYHFNCKNLRYVVAGEYGPKTLRPHYHLAIWGIKPTDLKEYNKNKQGDMRYTSEQIEKIWGNGFIIIGELTQQSSSYIARYVTKKIIEPNHEIPGTTEEFIKYSKRPAVGLVNWLRHKDEYIKNKGLFIKINDKVRLFSIPSLFMKKWKEETLQEYNMDKNFLLDIVKYMKNAKNQEEYKEREREYKEYIKATYEINDLLIAEPYYEFKRNNIKLAQENQKRIEEQTDLNYIDYLKVIENKLMTNAKQLKRDQI